MGAGAQIGEIPLAIEGDGLPLVRVFLHQLEFVGLVRHEGAGLPDGQLEPFDGQGFLGDTGHFGLDFLEIVGGEGLLPVEVVIKTVVDGRADGEFYAGEEVQHRLG